MLNYLVIVNKGLSNELEIDCQTIQEVQLRVRQFIDKPLDVMVFEGTEDDPHADYLKTLDPITLEDKGY
jgi:hypothetical protein